jgi:hypothetical protein
MTGGVVKDAMDEAAIKPNGQPGGQELLFDEKLCRLQNSVTTALSATTNTPAPRKRFWRALRPGKAGKSSFFN